MHMSSSPRMTSTLFTLFFASTAFFSSTLAAHWSPKLLTPNGEVGWVIGTRANVTWDTSNPPDEIVGTSRIELAKGGIYVASGPGSEDEPLAEGFNLLDGYVEVTVPDVELGSDYQVGLFGDSGNLGPMFTISN